MAAPPGPRSFKELAAKANIDLAAPYFTDDDLARLSKERVPLTIETGSLTPVEDLPAKYEFVARLPDGTRGVISLWENVHRAANCVPLLQLLQDGPVDGVVVSNYGSEKKPVYTLAPA